MTIQEKSREWAEKRAKEMMSEPAMSSINQIMERAYLAGAAGAMEWVPLTDGLPNPEIVGEKVLVNRTVNDSQKGLRVTVYDTAMLRFCEPETTHWMPLPPHPEK